MELMGFKIYMSKSFTLFEEKLMKRVILLVAAMSCLILLTPIMLASATDSIHLDNKGGNYGGGGNYGSGGNYGGGGNYDGGGNYGGGGN